jgi:hypothetical protein
MELERALIAIISAFRPTVKASEQVEVGERHKCLLREKRREMLDYVFALFKEQYRGDA